MSGPVSICGNLLQGFLHERGHPFMRILIHHLRFCNRSGGRRERRSFYGAGGRAI
jgi:hypothetical protein